MQRFDLKLVGGNGPELFSMRDTVYDYLLKVQHSHVFLLLGSGPWAALNRGT